jgi:hypothetical protein
VEPKLQGRPTFLWSRSLMFNLYDNFCLLYNFVAYFGVAVTIVVDPNLKESLSFGQIQTLL